VGAPFAENVGTVGPIPVNATFWCILFLSVVTIICVRWSIGVIPPLALKYAVDNMLTVVQIQHAWNEVQALQINTLNQLSTETREKIADRYRQYYQLS